MSNIPVAELIEEAIIENKLINLSSVNVIKEPILDAIIDPIGSGCKVSIDSEESLAQIMKEKVKKASEEEEIKRIKEQEERNKRWKLQNIARIEDTKRDLLWGYNEATKLLVNQDKTKDFYLAIGDKHSYENRSYEVLNGKIIVWLYLLEYDVKKVARKIFKEKEEIDEYMFTFDEFRVSDDHGHYKTIFNLHFQPIEPEQINCCAII